MSFGLPETTLRTLREHINRVGKVLNEKPAAQEGVVTPKSNLANERTGQ
jgi:hypothetical protein